MMQPDFAVAAATLEITEDELMTALGITQGAARWRSVDCGATAGQLIVAS